MASYGFHSPAPRVVNLMGEKTNPGLRKPTMNQSASQPRPYAALALILIHLVISIVHGSAHQGAEVALTTFGNVYVLVIITLAPLVAAGLLFTRKQKLGALLLALSMFGSFLFGFWYHFLSATNDNVSEVHGPWHSTFLWTAIELAVIELVGTVLGLMIYRLRPSLRPKSGP